MSVAEEKSEIKLISSVIESIKPSFSNSEIDQETLAKLEQLWIKKLKILEERDQDNLERRYILTAEEQLKYQNE